MLWFLCALSPNFKHYNLIPPFDIKQTEQIGNWTFQGTATNLKDFIRLTSVNSKKSKYSIICNNVPTIEPMWDLGFQFRISQLDQNKLLQHNKHKSSTSFEDDHYIKLIFSDEFCPSGNISIDPQESQPWHGFMYAFDLSGIEYDSTSSSYSVPLSFYEGTKSTPIYSDRLHFSPNQTLILQLLHSPKHFGALTNLFRPQGSSRLFDHNQSSFYYNYEYGYLSVRAQSSLYDIDLLSLALYAYNNATIPEEFGNISQFNQHVINLLKHTRKHKKEERHEKMQKTLQTLSTIYNSSGLLSENNNHTNHEDLIEALNIIREADERAHQTITFRELTFFIESYIMNSLRDIVNMTSYEMNQIDKTGKEINDIMLDAVSKLKEITNQANIEMERVKREIIGAAKSHASSIRLMASSLSVHESVYKNKITVRILHWIMIIEFVCYIGFIIHKRNVLRNLKVD